MSSKPVIGVTLDSEKEGDYSPFPFYALRQNYIRSIAEHGAIPLPLPHEVDAADAYLERIDGLLVTGGAFDIPPSYYGVNMVHETVETKDARTAFEFAMMQGALKQDKPILGICGGEQLLNVVLGGTLVQHIPDEIENCLEHEVKDRLNPAHDIAITEGTLLHKITGVTQMGVNTSHHQAVKTVGDDVVINAVAPDGVIEGIEYTKHPFCLGVEWHPEYQIHKYDSAILKAFVDACRDR